MKLDPEKLEQRNIYRSSGKYKVDVAIQCRAVARSSSHARLDLVFNYLPLPFHILKFKK